MFNIFGKPRENKPTPPWVMWLMIGVVVYALIAHQRKPTEDAPNTIHESINKASKELSLKRFVNIDEYKNKVFPGYASALRIKDVTVGKGMPVICGQKVSIAYETSLADGTVIDSSASKEKPFVFQVGKDKVLPALMQGVLGMQAGGKRSIIAPSNLAYGSEAFAREGVPPGASVKLDMELLENTPLLADLAETSYRTFDTVAGKGLSASCGSEAKLHLTLWHLDGKKLFSTKDKGGQPIAIIPGTSTVFLGLEQGVIGMSPGGVRTLIVPPGFQKTLYGNKPSIDFPFPKQQTVLVDIELE